MVKEQIPTQSYGKSQSQNESSSRVKELEAEVNYLRYQNSLQDQTAFRDLLMRQLQIMNQNLLGIKEEIVKASGEEGFSEENTKDTRHTEKLEPAKKQKYSEPEDDESDSDDEENDEPEDIEFEEQEERGRGRPRK